MPFGRWNGSKYQHTIILLDEPQKLKPLRSLIGGNILILSKAAAIHSGQVARLQGKLKSPQYLSCIEPRYTIKGKGIGVINIIQAEMKIEDLKKWDTEWRYVNKIVLWGYGKNCKLHLEELKKNYSIVAIVDNDVSKEGKTVDDVPIVSPTNIDLTDKKIVITTHYEEISSQLEDMGLKEYSDFCDVRVLISAHNWYRYKRVVLSELHIAVTTACTLNCKYCNMYMPFHRGHMESISLENLKEQLSLLFSHVDYVIKLVLIGGETFLYKELGSAIEYIKNNFFDKVGNIEIITNGTVVPQDSLVDILQKYNVLVSMSNYRLNDAYNKQFAQVREILTDHGICIYINQDLQWKNFSFPYQNLNLSDAEAYKNMDLCNPVFRGFNDSKFYFCHLVWSANKAGIFNEKNTDYIDFTTLKEEEHEKIVLFNICCHDESYVSLCKECGGCSSMNQKFVPVGEQA